MADFVLETRTRPRVVMRNGHCRFLKIFGPIAPWIERYGWPRPIQECALRYSSLTATFTKRIPFGALSRKRYHPAPFHEDAPHDDQGRRHYSEYHAQLFEGRRTGDQHR